MDISSVQDNFQKISVLIFFYFFVCIFCEKIGKSYLTTMFWNEKHNYKMMLMKKYSIFHVPTWKLKLSQYFSKTCKYKIEINKYSNT